MLQYIIYQAIAAEAAVEQAAAARRKAARKEMAGGAVFASASNVPAHADQHADVLTRSAVAGAPAAGGTGAGGAGGRGGVMASAVMVPPAQAQVQSPHGQATLTEAGDPTNPFAQVRTSHIDMLLVIIRSSNRPDQPLRTGRWPWRQRRRRW